MPNQIINFKKEFFEGVNADDNPRFLGKGEALNIENLRCGVSEYTNEFQLSNLPSTELLYYYVPNGSVPIGRVFDYNRRRLIWFNYDPAGDHAIYAYDLNENTTYLVLIDTQLSEGFNFSKSFRISRNAKVVNNLLVWTDNNNEPQCISIEAGIKSNQSTYVTDVAPYLAPIPYTTATLIKRPPTYVPEVAKQFDPGYTNNFVDILALQFAYYYTYKNYNDSALSSYSALVPFNFGVGIIVDNFNYVSIKIPFAEHIDDYIQSVNLCVKYGNAGKTKVIRTWDKDSFYDAIAIENHNDGTTQLYYNFYGNVAGNALDDVTANTPFHDVPLKAKTVEDAVSRVFLGNILKGYNTPAISSLQATTSLSSTATRIFKSGSSYKISIAFFDRFKRKCSIVPVDLEISVPDRLFSTTDFTQYINWTLNNLNTLVEIPDFAYYYCIYITKNLQRAFYIQGGSVNQSYVTKNVDDPTKGLYNYGNVYGNNTYAVAVDLSQMATLGYGYSFNQGDIAILYKSDDTNYKLRVIGTDGSYVLLQAQDIGAVGNAFSFSFIAENIDLGLTFDYWIFGMTYNDTFTFDGFSAQSVTSSDWDGTNLQDKTNNIISIFDGNAYNFYLNGTLTIKITSAAVASFTIYAVITQPSGAATIFDILINNTSPVDGQTYTYTINTSISVPAGYTKVFILAFFDHGGVPATVAAVIYGNLTFTQPTDLMLIEIYTPRQVQEIEPYYEASPIYPITNPTLSNREYSVLSGSLIGDSYKLINFTPFYRYEAMSPNILTWQDWERDLGWINNISYLGQQQEKDSITWSETYINGTKTNGLNKFDPLNVKNVGNSSGQIQKLQLANKVVDESGNIMLVICQDEILSAYLGEVQTFNAASQGALITTDAVIGTINAMKYTAGTINPESVVEYNGIVWGVDVIRGIVWQYDPNGVSPVSYYGMRRFFTRFSQRYLELGAASVEALCGFSYIESCVDPTTSELLFTLPQTEINVVTSGIPVGFAKPLPSYDTLPAYASSIQNRFDIYDGNPKTLIYKFNKNKWFGAYQWLPDFMEYGGNKLFGFKDGWLYQFNESTTSFNTIFGVEYPQRICFTVNLQPNIPMDIFDLSIEGNMKIPNFTVCYCLEPNEQITDLTAEDYRNLEGVIYAKFYRDRLTPSITGTIIDKLYKGDVLKSIVAEIMIEWQIYDSQLINNFVNIGIQLSAGHIQIIAKPNQ